MRDIQSGLELFSDGMLKKPSLHDSTLTEFRKKKDGAIEITFLTEAEEVYALRVGADLKPHVWCEGNVSDIIVSNAWMKVAPFAETWLLSILDQDALKRFEYEKGIYSRNCNWLFTISTNFGSPVILFGKGTIDAMNLRIELEAS